ncbi:MAG: type I-U CRISPR-associated helicase/endonuclease Cas3, partial [Candidatus Dadabacteria bacterium]|nr:type I-U CRISPR-associated helicase/endonuclease Cas3 [Candidatus Dadabacteria bacterium]
MNRDSVHTSGHTDKRVDSDRLALGDFVEFFKDIHKQEPFPWQRRLMKRVLDRGWPSVIDLPTGAGKTAVLDIAVFAMAARPDISPRRVVFVIDRRIVVDQVYDRAMRIRNRIQNGDTPTLQVIRERLQRLTDGGLLGVAALQGGIPLDNEWARRPDQPWVIVSTVDQFGSRLLFRGYGVSPSMRPIHAGLAGNDCLVILDEVHLSVPFAQTLAQVAKLDKKSIDRRFVVVEMSATPSNTDAECFTLDHVEDVEKCEEMRRRVTAEKEAKLYEVKDQDAIPATTLEIIRSATKGEDAKDINSVGVVVNTVRTARETHHILAENGYSVHLITGRMRPLDRKRVMENIKSIVDPDDKSGSSRLTVVVSTQAIEVGADISFDALVTECAAVDSLRQRFGRLDRRGHYFSKTGVPAKAWIIGLKSILKSKKSDPIYGFSTQFTWKELKRRAKSDLVGVGPLSLKKFPSEATAPRLAAPLLLHTHMDFWFQTNPESVAQSVEWFLHGIKTRRIPDVSIVWRRDTSTEALRLVPPRQAEFLQIPIHAVQSWLSAGDEEDVADAYQSVKSGQEKSSSKNGADKADAMIWCGVKEGLKNTPICKIKPGEIIVVESNKGGLRNGTWDPSFTGPVSDLGDEAQLAHRGRVTLRLDPALTTEFGLDPPKPRDQINSDLSESESIRQWMKQVKEKSVYPLAYESIVEQLGDSFEIMTLHTSDSEDADNYYILVKQHRTKKPVVDIATMDGTDETCSLIGTRITLRQHLSGVA